MNLIALLGFIAIPALLGAPLLLLSAAVDGLRRMRKAVA